ncbi:Spindle assembly abnormal protein 6 like protein [Argiope bruennichi]|uniref:Spindle assembly abnormal protein 6 homolog n=1 Tax=Argiope bruennichi TaxID=94029 RepID=A0A8T0E6X6_ARGBR|nr:Spindle assembly abnormal protein 6 like protein [Argiope bruennichi]
MFQSIYKSDPTRVLSKLRIIKNLIMISLSFLFLKTGDEGLIMLQTTMNKEEGIGTISMAVTFVSYGLTSLLFSSFIVKKLGSKYSLLLGITSCLPFIASNFYPTWITLLPAAIFRGLGNSLLWASQGTYFNESSVLFCKLKNDRKKFKCTSNAEPNYENVGINKQAATFESDGHKIEQLSASDLLKEKDNSPDSNRSSTMHYLDTSSIRLTACRYENSLSENKLFPKVKNTETKRDNKSNNLKLFNDSVISKDKESDVKERNEKMFVDTISEKIDDSQETAKYQSYADSTKALFFGFHGMVYHCATVFSSLISYYVLKTGDKDYINSTSNYSCGASFCSANEEDSNNIIADVPDGTRYLLIGVCITCGIIAPLLVLLFLDQIAKRTQSAKFSWHHLFATIKYIKKKNQLLLIPFTIGASLCRGFYMADFTKSYIACAWSISHIGLITIIYGITSALLSLFSGVVIKYAGRRFVMVLCHIITIANLVFLYFWNPNAQQPYIFYIQGGIFGMIAGIFNSQTKGDEETAFSSCNLYTSIGWAVPFIYNDFFCVSVKIYIVLAFSCTGLLGKIMEALKLKRKTVRSAFTRLFNHLDESAKTEVNIADDLDCLATFQLLGEKNNELLQLNEDILNLLLMSEDINEDDIEKESRSADEYSLNFKRMSLLVDRKTNPTVNADTLSSGPSELWNCGQRSHAVMCPDRKTVESSNSQEATESSINFGQFNTLTNPTCSTSVFLQTLVVVLRGETQDFAVRALIDTGSQKSYITKEAAKKMKYPALKETTLIHTLFGGMQNPQKHSEYKIFVSDFNKNYHCTFNAFDQEKICAEICQIPTGFWSKELEDNGIHLTDQECLPSCSSFTIHLLIGADIAGKLMTGKILNLTCGLTATETLLGWTLMGRAPSSSDSISMTVTNLLIKDCNISDLFYVRNIILKKTYLIQIMLPTNSEKEKLFSKSVCVTVKDGSSIQCRTSRLLLTVEWQETPSSLHRQELLITLTDNNDPFFLHHLQLSEEDFQMLKTSQGLLVDFSAFPQKFIDLIEVCLAEENKPQPKFLLMFHLSDKAGHFASSSQLDIVETNPFKHLTHLSLKFVPATDSTVKQYLATCFKNLKDENYQLHTKLNQLNQDYNDHVSSSRVTLDQKVQELEMVRKQLSVELSMMESKHARELQEEKDKFLHKQNEVESRLEKERKEQEDNFRKETQRLEARVTCLSTLNKDLQEKNSKYENSIRELRSEIQHLEEESRKNKEALRNYKAENETLQNEVGEKRLRLSNQKKSIEELEKEVAHKKQQIERLEEIVNHHQKQEKALELELEEVNSKFQRNLKRCDYLEEDISKANEVIDKLQREIQSGHEKLKQKNYLLSKQELSLSEKDKIIQMLQKELKDTKLDLKRKNSEVKNLSDSITSLEEKVSNLEKDLKSRDGVIKYLNRQLTDRCILPQYVPPSSLAISPTQAVKINSAGDVGALALGSEKSKGMIGRNDSTPYKEESHNSAQTPVDSAYISSPSGATRNANASPAGDNNNVANFELDSSALSAAFGSGQALKHSTAKKSFGGRSNKNIVKKK